MEATGLLEKTSKSMELNPRRSHYTHRKLQQALRKRLRTKAPNNGICAQDSIRMGRILFRVVAQEAPHRN